MFSILQAYTTENTDWICKIYDEGCKILYGRWQSLVMLNKMTRKPEKARQKLSLQGQPSALGC